MFQQIIIKITILKWKQKVVFSRHRNLKWWNWEGEQRDESDDLKKDFEMSY